MQATNYFHYDKASGSITGVGYTPDGTVPDDCVPCTPEQALFPQKHIVDLTSLDVISAPIAQLLECEKLDKWSDIKAERDRRTDQGGYKVGTKWFHSDQKSRSQQMGLVLLGASIPANLQWKTMDGSFVTMTASLAQQVLGAAAASDQAIFAAAETHKAAMEASADPSAYDFSGGWPETFAG